jgi:hypothetical protein
MHANGTPVAAVALMSKLFGGGIKLAAVTAAIAGTMACEAQPRQRPLDIGPVESKVAEARKILEGRWMLQSFEVRPPGGAPIVLNGSGILNYDDFGNLYMDIRADQASSDLLRAAGIEIRDGVIATEGRTVIDLPNKTLTYFLEGQRSSTTTGGGPLAPNRPRHWDLTADVLTLTTRDDTGAPFAISRWKKSP